MATAKKIGNRVGSESWEKLETIADLRRFLRWVILSMRDTTLEPNQASIFAQIGGVLSKVVQANDIEQRLEKMETQMDRIEKATHKE